MYFCTLLHSFRRSP